MKLKISIYLAGSIKKGHEKSDDSYWTEEDIAFLKGQLKDSDVSILNPAFRTDDLSDQRSVFGRDMVQVFSSHVVFADVRDRRGLGVGAEMMWAKINKIPVIAWAPRNSHYRKDETTLLGVAVKNFVHPFVEALSDKIVEDLVEGAKWIREILSNPSFSVKGIEEIASCMQYYKDHQLHLDQPMQELLLSSKELENRMKRKVPQVNFTLER